MDRAQVGELLESLGFHATSDDGKRWKAPLGGEGRRYAVSAKISSSFTHLRVKRVLSLGEPPYHPELLPRLMRFNQEMPVVKFGLDKDSYVNAILTLPNQGVDDELVNSSLSLLSYYVRRCERKLSAMVRGKEAKPQRAVVAKRPVSASRPNPFSRPASEQPVLGTPSRVTMILDTKGLRAGLDIDAPRVVFKPGAPKLEQVWSCEVGAALTGVPAVYSDRVLFACRDSSVYGLSLKDGSNLWSFECKGTPSTPVAAKRQFFCVVGSSLLAVDIRSGRKVWDVQHAAEARFSTPTLHDGCVLVGSVDGKLLCIDGQTGSELWSYQCQASVLSAPVVHDDQVYVVASDGHIYVLQFHGGKERARFMITGGMESVGFCAPWIFAAVEGQRLMACDLAMRKQIWEMAAGEDFKTVVAPTADEDRVVFTTGRSQQNRLFALDSASGEPLWTASTGGWGHAPVALDDVLFVASGRHLYKIAANSGKTLACLALDAPVSSGLSIGLDRLYVGTEGGRAYCVDTGERPA